MRIASRLHRNRHGFFGLRVVIPHALRHRFGRSEFRLSLRTNHPARAKAFAPSLNTLVQHRFHQLARMPNEHEKSLLPTLIDDLEGERKRLSEELSSIAEDWAGIDELVESLQGRLKATEHGRKQLDAVLAQPKQLLPSVVRDVQAAAARLDEERTQIIDEVFRAAEREEVLLQRAMELRNGFQRVQLSAEHRAILERCADEFERRAKDMERLVVACGRANNRPLLLHHHHRASCCRWFSKPIEMRRSRKAHGPRNPSWRSWPD